MLIIPVHHGYIVTDGLSCSRMFLTCAYGTREEARNAAIAFAYQMELYYPRMSVIMRFPVKGTLHERLAWR